MITKTAKFEALEGKRKTVVEAIEVFTRAVHVSEPGCRLYVSLQDNSNPDIFLHVMAFENEGAELKHQQAGYTQEFVQIVNKNCKKDPVFKTYEYVGGL
ncbi:MAG: antibiotic biosynthesis monooxygenase [Cyclobacteriaceae bacterium]|jgi:quinol monooxygenase YgiN